MDKAPLLEVSGDQPASRPGKKTLIATLAIIAIAIAIKFSEPLMGLLSYGR